MSSTKIQKHHGITWLDLGNPTKAAVDKLADSYPFHPVHLEESLLTGYLPQVEKEKEYLFVLLHIPNQEPDGSIVSDQLAIFLGKDFLVTLHNESADGLTKLFQSCEEDGAQRDRYFNHSSAHLLYRILGGLLDGAAEVVQSCLERLDEIEAVVFDDKITASYDIGSLRQKITKLKRLTDFLNATLGEISSNANAFTGEDLSHHSRSISKTVTRLSVALEEAKETIEIYKDADFTASSARTNEVLVVLTIIFTLTIPATILGTFYGMNVPLPGGIQAGAWTFWGPYTTLILVLAASTILALAMAWYFWKKKWF